jgi:DNA-binding PadR family transcriptional regulator
MHGSYACPPPWGMRFLMSGRRSRRGDWTAPGWGPGPWVVWGGGKGWGQKAGRGDVRAAVLELLAEEPMHGYQIMQELSERSGGMWRPSPGSVYPTLQQLADEGLVRAEDSEGKIVYHLTDIGREQVEAQDSPPPWARFERPVDEGLFALKDLAIQLGAAVMQVAAAGNGEQVDQAKKILADARSKLYQLLAEDEAD